jgi:hypothetical protein
VISTFGWLDAFHKISQEQNLEANKAELVLPPQDSETDYASRSFPSKPPLQESTRFGSRLPLQAL